MYIYMWCVLPLLLLFAVSALALPSSEEDKYDPKFNATFYTRGWHKYQTNTLFVNGDWVQDAGFRDIVAFPDADNNIVESFDGTSFTSLDVPLTLGDDLGIGYLGMVDTIRMRLPFGLVSSENSGMNSTEFLNVAHSTWLPFHGHATETWCIQGRPFQAVGVHGAVRSRKYAIGSAAGYGCGLLNKFVSPAFVNSLLSITGILTQDFVNTQELDAFFDQYGTDAIIYIHSGYWGMNLTFYDDDNITSHVIWPGSNECAFNNSIQGCLELEPSQLRYVEGRSFHRCIDTMDLSLLGNITEELRQNLYNNMADRIHVYEREAGTLENIALQPTGMYDAMMHCTDEDPEPVPDDDAPLDVWKVVALSAMILIVGLIVVIVVGYCKMSRASTTTSLNSDGLQETLLVV